MKKAVVFFVFIIATAGIIWGLDYYSTSQNNSSDFGKAGGIINEPKVVRDFKVFCDSLRLNLWEPEAFRERMDRLSVFKNQDLINATEYIYLEEYMYAAYSASIINSFEQWKQACKLKDLSPILKEIKRISRINQGSKDRLRQTSTEIAGFYELVGTPQKVKNLISSKYDEVSFNQLLMEVENLPSYFKNCSSVNRNKYNANSDLQNFKAFASEFKDLFNAYLVNPSDVYTIRDLTRLCTRAQSGGYFYYSEELSRIKLCK